MVYANFPWCQKHVGRPSVSLCMTLNSLALSWWDIIGATALCHEYSQLHKTCQKRLTYFMSDVQTALRPVSSCWWYLLPCLTQLPVFFAFLAVVVCNWCCFRPVSVSWVLWPSVLWRCWLGGRKGIRPVKNWVVGCWHSHLSGARCRLAYGPADASATHCLLLQ